MKGRKPKPLAIAQIDGTRKSRINEHAPQSPLGLPRCPAHLDKEAAAKWRQLAKDAKWFARVDADVVALYCVQWSMWIRALSVLGDVRKAGNNILPELLYSKETKAPYQNAVWHLATGAHDRLLKLSAVLGLNPSDRGRLSVPAPSAEEDELEAFMAEAQ